MNDDIITDEFVDAVRKRFKFVYTSGSELKEILGYGDLKEYTRGSFVYMEDDPVEACYCVVSGKIEIFKNTENLGRRIFAFVGKYDIFGYPEIFQEKQIMSAEVLDDTVCIVIDRQTYLDKVLAMHNFCRDLVRIEARMIGDLQRSAIIERAEKRLYHFLHYLAGKTGVDMAGKIAIPRKFTHEKLSEILSLSRETVSRILLDLQKKEIIMITKEQIIIIRPDVLFAEIDDMKRLPGFYGTDNPDI